MNPTQVKLESLIEAIKSLHETVDRLSKYFRNDVEKNSNLTELMYSPDYWRVNTYGNALVRLRIILEQNFVVIETLGLVAVTRYIFELSLWLQLFEVNANYTLVYHKRQIDVQKRFYKDTLKHHEREVELLKTFDVDDSRRMDETIITIKYLPNQSSEEITAVYVKGIEEVDDNAARVFSTYTDQAKTNGYGHQAHLIETKVIPKLRSTVEELKKEINEFDRNTSERLRDLIGCTKWEKMAEKANMTAEYEYIYRYTSKLLHCTPASVTTNQKCLEPEEVVIFLRYIYIKIQDIIDLAKLQPEYNDMTDIIK